MTLRRLLIAIVACLGLILGVVPAAQASVTSVTGTVVDPSGDPISDVWVTLYQVTVEDGAIVDTQFVDEVESEDGSYTFDLPDEVASYTVVASASGRPSRWLGNTASDLDAEFFSGASLDGPQLSPIVVPDASRVEGHVTDGSSAASDVSVVLWTYEDDDWNFVDATSTDDDGSYTIAAYNPGTYTLTFDDQRYGGGTGEPSGEPTASTSFTLAEGQVRTVDFTVTPGIVGGGTIRSSTGPLAGATVQLYAWSDDEEDGGWYSTDRTATSASNGTYSFQRLRSGTTYTVRAVRSGYRVGVLGGGSAFGTEPTATNSFTVTGAPVTGLDVTLQPRTSTLGKVAGQKLDFCKDHVLAPNDDESSAAVDVPFDLKYFGNSYSSLYVNNNGNVTFDQAESQFTPDALDGGTSAPIIAPFFADVDTRDTEESDVVSFGASPDGTQFCVNWADVEPFEGLDRTGAVNTFQLILTSRSGTPGRSAGDFDITYNYDQIQWDTGDASDGISAVAGFAGGTGVEGTYFQLPGSLVPESLLDSGDNALIQGRQNSATNGRYVFEVRNAGLASSLGSLDGEVRLPGVPPAADSYVEIIGGTRAYYTQTNDEGRYFVSGVQAGTYTVRAWPNSTGLLQAAASVPVVAGETAHVPPLTFAAPRPMPPAVGLTSPTFGSATPGSVPTVYYQDDLALTYTGPPGRTATYVVTAADGQVIRQGGMTETSSGVYRATVPELYPTTGDATIAITLAGESPVAFNIYIDPSGTVVDAWGLPVAGATATLLRSETPDGEYVPVPNGSDVMSERNRVNPSLTGDDGIFGWDVTAAWYKVRVEKAGYTTMETTPLQVPPERLDLVLKLVGGTAPTWTSAISGTPAVGQQLTAQPPTQAGATFKAVAHQWRRDGVPISGATAATYTPTAADAGANIDVAVTMRRDSVAVDPLEPGVRVDFEPVVAVSPRVAVPAPPAPPAVVKAASKLKVKATSPARGKARLSVVLTLPGTAASATSATVLVYDGKKLVKRAKVVRGKATVSLKKLKKGKHTFKVVYGGSSGYQPSKASTRTKVK